MNRWMKWMLSLVVAGVMAGTAACSTEAGAPEGTDTGTKSETIEITDAHGTVSVPVRPETVVALDNRTFDTLADWDIALAAAPKDVMHADSPYIADDSVLNVGNHREPNLEIIAQTDPDLVIVGQRFASFYDDIRALVPNAAVIDLNIDVSEEAGTPGENLANGMKESTRTLGAIFEMQDEAEALVAEFERALEDAKSAYNGTDTVMAVVVSGGDIGFAAPGHGRVWGPLYELFDWTPALEIDQTSSDHMGDDVSVEAIAQSNPDWLLVLDRDAATASDVGAVPAQDVISGAPALQNTNAVRTQQVVYAPNRTYTTESIRTMIELFETLRTAFSQ